MELREDCKQLPFSAIGLLIAPTCNCRLLLLLVSDFSSSGINLVQWIQNVLFVFLPMVMGTEDAAGGEETIFQINF